MDNWIDLSNLPRRIDGKISWKDCDNNLVNFCFDGLISSFIVVKRLDIKHVLINYEDKQYEINTNSIMHIQLASFVRYSKIYCNSMVKINPMELYVNLNYHYNTDDVVQIGNKQILILNRITLLNGRIAAYRAKCLTCKYEFDITDYAMQHGYGCPSCTKHKVIIGDNDLWTTRPDVAVMLSNPEDGFIYTAFSNQKVDFSCDKCGKYIGNKIICNVSKCGLSCKYCSDGISYPNKMMSNLLYALSIDFDSEVQFQWCVFPNFNNSNELSYGKYDFVIEDRKMIIEMDGGLGHGNSAYSGSRYSKEELIYRDEQKDKLAMLHGYEVIRIDCDYANRDKYNHCCESIINSLSDIFDLSGIDWNDINLKSTSSYTLQSIELYKNGLSPKEISETINRDYSCVLDDLHRGTELGLCKYYTCRNRQK